MEEPKLTPPMEEEMSNGKGEPDDGQQPGDAGDTVA